MRTINRTKNIIIGFVALMVIRTLLGYAGRLETDPAWIQVAIQAIAGVVTVFLLITILAWLWMIARKFIVGLWRDLFNIEAEPEIDGAAAATDTTQKISAILARAEQDSSQAGILLADAQQYAEHLVRIVQSISLKAEDMQREVDGLQMALEAIETTDPVKISKAAGMVIDEHIRSLMTAKVRDADYWQNVAQLIAVQLGTLVQWGGGYRVFAGRLMGDISEAKARLAASQAALELTEAGRPLAQIDHKLIEAGRVLRFNNRPGLTDYASALPTVEAGLAICKR